MRQFSADERACIKLCVEQVVIIAIQCLWLQSRARKCGSSLCWGGVGKSGVVSVVWRCGVIRGSVDPRGFDRHVAGIG